MSRIRLRQERPEGEAAYYSQVYPDGYKHDRWPDHVERVAASVRMINRWVVAGRVRNAADLSCGDGAILRAVAPHLEVALLGDLNGVSPQAQLEVAMAGARAVGAVEGPLPDTLENIPDSGVDLFVLSETIEHMDDPDALLRAIAGKAHYLFLSTPLDEPFGSGNMEHYWGWGQADVHTMLQANGWSPLEVELFTPASTRHMDHAYTFQLWMAVRA